MNYKIKLLSTTALAGSLLVGLSPVALAAEEAAEYKSNAIVEFVPDEETITDPVDPTDPEKPNPGPVDPTDPENPNPEPGTKGPLSIDYASSLNFGENKISSSTKTYYAAAQKFTEREDGPNYVQITDSRGLETGWTLKVKQNGQFVSSKENKELTGATLTFENGNVISGSESAMPSLVNGNFILDSEGSSQIVMGAKNAEGAGTYVLAFGQNENAAESISLTVPGKTTKYADKYSTSLTWTLEDVPASE